MRAANASSSTVKATRWSFWRGFCMSYIGARPFGLCLCEKAQLGATSFAAIWGARNSQAAAASIMHFRFGAVCGLLRFKLVQ